MSDSVTHDLEERLADEVEDAIATAHRPQGIPVNMYEAEEALVLVAALPGVMADDVTVEVHPGRVHLVAAMRTAAPKDYLLHEWHYGPYERSVRVPSGWGAAAQATFGNGQLAVRLTKGDPPDEGVVVHPTP